MNKTISLKKDTTLVEVLDKIKDAKEVILIIPPDNKDFLKEITYKILKEQIDSLGKKVYIYSPEKRIIKLAKENGINVLSKDEKLGIYVKEVFYEPKREFSEKEISKVSPKKPQKTKIKILISFIFIFLLIGVSIYFFGIYVINKANIYIKLQSGSKFFSYEFNISTSTFKSDSSTKTLKGIFVNEVIPITLSFPVKNTSEVLLRASGKIKIKNYGPAFSLISNTRFLSEDGKIFRILEKLNVPAGSKENPSLTEVTVFADEPGQGYNISPTKFTIPGLKGTEIEKNIEVFSEQAFSGGGKFQIKVPSFQDYVDAQKEFERYSTDYLGNYLKKKFPEVKFWPEMTILSFSIDKVEPKDVKIVTSSVEEIKMYGSGKIIALGIRKNELVELIKDLEVLSLQEGFKIEEVKIEKENIQSYDLGAGFAKILVEGKTSIKYGFHETNFKKEIAGKKIDEVYNLLKEKKGIERVRIVIWPFWVKEIPKDFDKIKVEIE